jgi:hypothetical protein
VDALDFGRVTRRPRRNDGSACSTQPSRPSAANVGATIRQADLLFPSARVWLAAAQADPRGADATAHQGNSRVEIGENGLSRQVWLATLQAIPELV